MGNKRRFLALGALSLLAITAAINSAAHAYDQQVYNNLNRTRDALLDQRQHLNDAYNETSKQISALQSRLDRVNSYLQQNDQAIRDVDNALRQLQ